MKTIINAIQARHNHHDKWAMGNYSECDKDRQALLDIIRDITEYMKDATFHRAEIMEIINRPEP